MLRQNAAFTSTAFMRLSKKHAMTLSPLHVRYPKRLGAERKWVHYGLTSTDVVDTALGYVLRQANEILEKDIVNFIEILREKALAYKDTPMMGRTHGVHAEPTTFGLKMALWHEEMKRNLERFRHAADGVQYGKISGAVGTYANIDPFVEEFVCDKLGTKPAPISTQTLQRDRHAEYMAHWRWLLRPWTSSLQKFAHCRRVNSVKWKSLSPKVKKVPPRCRTSATQLAVKTFPVCPASFADIWYRLMRT